MGAACLTVDHVLVNQVVLADNENRPPRCVQIRRLDVPRLLVHPKLDLELDVSAQPTGRGDYFLTAQWDSSTSHITDVLSTANQTLSPIT
jgi:hypothetical protein